MKISNILYSGLGGHGNVVFSFIKGDKYKLLNHTLIFYGIEDLFQDYGFKCKEYKISYKYIKKKGGIDLLSWIKVYKALLFQRPDVILLHSVNLIAVVAFYSLFNSVKVISIEHNSNKIKKRSEWLWSILSVLFSYKVVYLTEFYKKEVKEKLLFFAKEKKMKIIQNGLDVNRYPQIRYPARTDIKLVMQSRFTKSSKDHETLVKAFAQFKKEKKNSITVQLILAGDGDSKKEIEVLVNKLGLLDSVIFTGMLNEDELLKLLSSTDIYIHSSIAETMSTAVMQAMACGLPVIATDIPGINHMIENNYTGYLFSPGDIPSLVEKMEKLIVDVDERSRLGSNARKFAVQHLSNERMFEEYHQLMVRN